MCSTSFKKVAQVLTPKIKNLFYDSNSKKTTPSCGISVKGDYKPGVCFHGYEIGCPASQTLPFFMNDFGPKYTEFTTTSHEQLPGHHLEVREATWCLFLLYILCVLVFVLCPWNALNSVLKIYHSSRQSATSPSSPTYFLLRVERNPLRPVIGIENVRHPVSHQIQK